MVIKGWNVGETLRRDATYVGNAAVAVVFLCFAAVVLAAAIIDVLGLRY
ncbi:hypothetical protein MXD81_33175 [Microbacteriaceae bacterium K1510]|nr:hypothetical protein [Microbacteriaceae bacterium K1510]